MTELIETKIVYMGRRILANDSEGKCYITVDKLSDFEANDKNDIIEMGASLFGFKKADHSPRIVGGIYEMKCILDDLGRINKCIAGGAKFIGMSSHRYIDVWHTSDEICIQKKKALNHLKKLEDNKHLDNEILRLKAHYKQLALSDKLAFELMLIHKLRKY